MKIENWGKATTINDKQLKEQKREPSQSGQIIDDCIATCGFHKNQPHR